MRRLNYRKVFSPDFFAFIAIVVFLFGFVSLSFLNNAIAAHEGEAGAEAGDSVQEEIPFDKPVEEIVKSIAPMNKLTLFPCSECHNADLPPDPARRELAEPHDETPGKFMNHDSGNRWCLDCHNTGNRDKLRLLNGKLAGFNEYYKVCEQCHRRIYREWKMGVHGKRTGYWNGEKQYLHCTQCHNPHNPPFQPLKPMPAPRLPKEILVTGAEK
ncbi:MAG: hypothetical protein HZC11_02505 [Nitrospirae bacterium]|nr:hypothetical protein [Nitrospirota bacterium]